METTHSTVNPHLAEEALNTVNLFLFPSTTESSITFVFTKIIKISQIYSFIYTQHSNNYTNSTAEKIKLRKGM